MNITFVYFDDAHPSQPSHSRMHNLAARSAALGEVSRAACSSLVGKYRQRGSEQRLQLDWPGARDTEMRLMRLPMPHSMRDPARRGRQRAIQMAGSASLAAVPAIVSPTHQPHAVPPPTTLVTAGSPAGRGGAWVVDGTDGWDATWQRQMKGCRKLFW